MRFIPNQDMKIIARQGEDTYLVETSDAEALGLRLTDGSIMYPSMLIGSITARGYWEAYDGTAEELAELLKRVCPHIGLARGAALSPSNLRD